MSQFISAESGIRQLYARFIDAVWRKDARAFADCFTEQGEWKIAGMHFKGRSEIEATFSKLMATSDRVLIIPGLPVLTVGEGTATGRIHTTELAKMQDGGSAMTLGVYYDRYIEGSDRWRFQWRHFSLHYRGPTDLSAALVESPDYGPAPGMPAPDEPTLTRRTQPI